MLDIKPKHISNFKSAPLWVFIDQGVGRFIRIGASIVMARILLPDDFGSYALSLGLLELARLSGNFGIGSAIIQTQDELGHFLNSAFWVNLIASFFMFINSFVIGYIGANFLHHHILTYAVPVLGTTFIIGGLTHINQSLLIRHLEFKVIAKCSVLRVILESVASITFALLGFRVWSFILGYVLGELVQAVMIWSLNKWRPKLEVNLRYPRRYWSFGSHIFLFCLSSFFLEHIPNIVIGKLSTVYILGLFTFAWRQSRWTGDLPKMIGKNFLFPAFSRFQDDTLSFEELYKKWIRLMLAWGAPVFMLQFILAPLYIPIIFGIKWIDSVGALQALVLLAFVEATFYTPHSEALTAMGKIQINAYWRIFESLAVFVVLFFVSHFGQSKIALGIFLTRFVIYPFYFLSTKSHLKLRNLREGIWPILILSCLGWGISLLLGHVCSKIDYLILSFVLSAGIVLWMLMVWHLVPEFKSIIQNVIQNLAFSFQKTNKCDLVIPENENKNFVKPRVVH